MRILVIGGNGFIGSHLVRELRAANHQIALLHRRADRPEADNELIQEDRNRLPDCRNNLVHFAPDVVVDLILSSGEQARQLVRTVSGIARRVVVISSMDVYRAWGVLHGVEPGPLEPLPLTEASPVRTERQLYRPEVIRKMQDTFSWLDDDYDKIAVEEAVISDSRVPATVLRLPMVYGPGDRLDRLGPLLKQIADGRPSITIPHDLAAWRGPRGYVENVAHAIALAATLDEASGRIYNVCDEPTLSELQWEQVIAEQANWRGKFVVSPKEQTPKELWFPRNADQHVVASSERIRSELGYREIVEMEEGIRRTIGQAQHNLISPVGI
jgi:nucleoside-diphosphate-sugar epimerase